MLPTKTCQTFSFAPSNEQNLQRKKNNFIESQINNSVYLQSVPLTFLQSVIHSTVVEALLNRNITVLN